MPPAEFSSALTQLPFLGLFMLGGYFIIRAWATEQAAQRAYNQTRDDKYLAIFDRYLAALMELSKMNHQSMSEAAKDAFDEALERIVSERMARDFERTKRQANRPSHDE